MSMSCSNSGYRLVDLVTNPNHLIFVVKFRSSPIILSNSRCNSNYDTDLAVYVAYFISNSVGYKQSSNSVGYKQSTKLPSLELSFEIIKINRWIQLLFIFREKPLMYVCLEGMKEHVD